MTDVKPTYLIDRYENILFNLLKDKKISKAQTLCHKLLVNHQEGFIYNYLGLTLSTQENYSEASKMYMKAYLANPEDDGYLYNFITEEIEHGDRKLAWLTFKKYKPVLEQRTIDMVKAAFRESLEEMAKGYEQHYRYAEQIRNDVPAEIKEMITKRRMLNRLEALQKQIKKERYVESQKSKKRRKDD
jgi:tetratricopeptide (TPR) repeat protein